MILRNVKDELGSENGPFIFAFGLKESANFKN